VVPNHLLKLLARFSNCPPCQLFLDGQKSKLRQRGGRSKDDRHRHPLLWELNAPSFYQKKGVGLGVDCNERLKTPVVIQGSSVPDLSLHSFATAFSRFPTLSRALSLPPSLSPIHTHSNSLSLSHPLFLRCLNVFRFAPFFTSLLPLSSQPLGVFSLPFSPGPSQRCTLWTPRSVFVFFLRRSGVGLIFVGRTNPCLIYSIKIEFLEFLI